MLTDKNIIIMSTTGVGQSLAFIQCDKFVFVAGQMAALLDERLLVC